MGVERKTVVTYTCDRCGHQQDTELAGGMCSTVSFNLSMVCYDGATGGSTSKYWLCATCTEQLRMFLAKQSKD